MPNQIAETGEEHEVITPVLDPLSGSTATPAACGERGRAVRNRAARSRRWSRSDRGGSPVASTARGQKIRIATEMSLLEEVAPAIRA